MKILQSLDTLGAGFTLASHDMDLRGAGNLVGDEQSGHIREVGFELYREADVFEGILELELLVIISLDGIGGGRNDLPFSTDSLPEFPVIKLAAIGITGGVVNVLHIGKNCDFIH